MFAKQIFNGGLSVIFYLLRTHLWVVIQSQTLGPLDVAAPISTLGLWLLLGYPSRFLLIQRDVTRSPSLPNLPVCLALNLTWVIIHCLCLPLLAVESGVPSAVVVVIDQKTHVIDTRLHIVDGGKVIFHLHFLHWFVAFVEELQYAVASVESLNGDDDR